MDNMSSKRRATTDLNHDNWDQEIEPENKGTFQIAPEDELKNRVIRKAHRKLPSADTTTPGTETDAQPKSVFSGFAGFGKTSSTSSSASTTVSMGSSIDVEKKSSEDTKQPASIFSFLTKFTPSGVSESKSDTPSNEILSTNNNNYSFAKSNTYYAKLKGLNQSVSSWIKTHVDKNPLCLLTPIFKDYEKYLLEIEKNEGSLTKPETNNATQSQVTSGFKLSTAPVPSMTFSFGNTKPDTADAVGNAATTKTSIFGNALSKNTEDQPKSTPEFSFGAKKTTDSATTPSTSGFTLSSFTPSSTTGFTPSSSTGFTPASSTGFTPASSTGFSFSGAKPFSFGNIAPPPAAEPSADKENGEDAEDEPPKVEFKAVVEEDSVYSHRCKVFVKNAGNFADRGVGTLYLKPVKDSEKMQLIVRADTNLGNILVNLILNDSIPTQRMGKNNVMLVCIPTPETEKPTPMLLRVKTSEEADELLATIDKYKK